MSNRQDKEQVIVRSTQLGPTVGHTLLIPATIHGKDTLMVVDTAAQMSMVSQSFIDSLEHAYTATPEFITIKNAEHGSYMQCYLIKELSITIQHNQYKIDVAVGPITDDFILGLDFLLKHHCIVDIDDSTVIMDGTPVHALMKKGPSEKYNVSRIQVAKRIVIVAWKPVPAWETAFSLWRGNSKVHLTAVVDNRVFPGDWQRPVIKGVTVSHQTVAIKTTYGVHPRLAKSITNKTWEMVQNNIGSPDCIAIGECGLDYTEPPHSLPSQRKLFGEHIALAKELEKPLVLHLRGNAHVPFSSVMSEALGTLNKHTHQRQLIHVHCFTGTITDYRQWVGNYSNTVFGITNKSVSASGFSELARQIDLYRLVLETDAPLLSSQGRNHGHPYEVVHQARYIASLRNVPSWVVLRVANLNAQAFYKV